MKSKKILSLIIAVAMVFTLISTITKAAALPATFTVVTEDKVPAVVSDKNIAKNGGFETQPSSLTDTVTPWKESVWDNTQAIEGNHSIKMNPTLTGDAGIGGNVAIDLLDDEAYKVTFYAKVDNYDPKSKAWLLAYFQGTPGDSPRASLNILTPGLSSGKWVKAQFYVRAGEIANGSYTLHFMRFGASDPATEPDATLETNPCPTFWVDNLSIEIVPLDSIVTPTPTPKPTVKPVKVTAPKKPTIKSASKITTKSKYIEGTTTAKAYVKVMNGKKLVAKKQADKKGKFKIKVNLSKMKKKTKLTIYAYKLNKKKEVKSKSVYITLKK